jgi:hypothetical protein
MLAGFCSWREECPLLALKTAVLLLATWRITAALVYDSEFRWLRDRASVHVLDERGVPMSFWGKVLECFWCTSWFTGGVLLPLILTPVWWILCWPALSGAAILLNHYCRIHLTRG